LAVWAIRCMRASTTRRLTPARRKAVRIFASISGRSSSRIMRPEPPAPALVRLFAVTLRMVLVRFLPVAADAHRFRRERAAVAVATRPARLRRGVPVPALLVAACAHEARTVIEEGVRHDRPR